MDVPAVSHRNGQTSGSTYLVQVQQGEVCIGGKGMNMIVSNGNHFPSHPSKAVIVRNSFKEHGATLHFVNMGLG